MEEVEVASTAARSCEDAMQTAFVFFCVFATLGCRFSRLFCFDCDERKLWPRRKPQRNALTDPTGDVDLGAAAAQIAGHIPSLQIADLGVGRSPKRQHDLAAVGVPCEHKIHLADARTLKHIRVMAQ